MTLLNRLQGSTRALVVTNAYPSPSNIYRNGFIHRRVVAYLQSGISCDVFYLHPPAREPYKYEYEGVKVIVGDSTAYQRHLATESYDISLVHFANPEMIEPLRDYPQRPLIVWIHGFEAEAWHRRWFSFIDGSRAIREALEKKRTYYEEQNAFMAWLLGTDELRTTIVHVSKWFQETIVEPDARAVSRRSVVIPNFVDTELFAYRPKLPDARTAILSIRPYASKKYANDLTVAAIEELRHAPYFDALTFTLAGDGELFDETTRSLRNLRNVKLAKGFIEQADIPSWHERHGVFLTPTRFDSQGVSMCEAMSSGLVPISNSIAAIPEFAQHRENSLLARPEDPTAIARAIEQLYYNPTLFMDLSLEAARRMREMCGYQATIGREVDLIEGELLHG